MSGIVGSRLNIRGSGVVGKLGTDGQVFTSAGAGKSAVYEDAAGFDVTSITGATALTATPDGANDELVLSDAGTLKRLDFKHIYNTPSFHVYKNGSQSLTDGTEVKCTFANEVWDSDGCYDSSTNYRFTPTTAGKYFFYCQLALDQGASASQITVAQTLIKKNGSTVSYDTDDNRGVAGLGYSEILTSTCCLEMDGSSDYVEGWGYLDWASGTAVFNGSAVLCFFGGWRLIGV